MEALTIRCRASKQTKRRVLRASSSSPTVPGAQLRRRVRRWSRKTHELGEHCRSWAPYQAWPRGPPASSLQAGLRKQPLQSPRHWGPRHTARQGVAVWVEPPPQGEARRASTNQRLWRARRERGKNVNASPIGRREKCHTRTPCPLERERAAPWDPGGVDAGERILNSKRPVEANKNDTEGIDAYNKTRRIRTYQKVVLPATETTTHLYLRTIVASHCRGAGPILSIQRARDCPGSFEGVAHAMRNAFETPRTMAWHTGRLKARACGLGSGF